MKEACSSKNSSSTMTSRFLRGGCHVLGISSSSRLSFPRPQWRSNSCSESSPSPLWSHVGWAAGKMILLSGALPRMCCSESAEAVRWCPAQAAGLASGHRPWAPPQQGRAGQGWGVPVLQALGWEGKAGTLCAESSERVGLGRKEGGVEETSGHCGVPSRRER